MRIIKTEMNINSVTDMATNTNYTGNDFISSEEQESFMKAMESIDAKLKN